MRPRPLPAALPSPRLALLLTALLAPPGAGAAPPAPRPASYDEAAAQAQRLDGLGPFLERYLGSCTDPAGRADCEQNVRAARRAADRSTFAASVAEQTLDLVRVERLAAGYRFVVTPFIDGGGLALTHGAPRRQDAAGHPLVPLVVLDGSLPPGLDDMALDSALRTGRLELQVVFQPEGTWKLPRKGEAGFYEGVKARFVALRLVESRSGAVLASRVL